MWPTRSYSYFGDLFGQWEKEYGRWRSRCRWRRRYRRRIDMSNIPTISSSTFIGDYVRQFRLMIPTTLAVTWIPLDFSFVVVLRILRSRESTSSSTSLVSSSVSAFSIFVISPSSTIVSVVPLHSDSGRTWMATTSPWTALLMFSLPIMR